MSENMASYLVSSLGLALGRSGFARAYTTNYRDELSKGPNEGLESNNFDKRIQNMEENDNQIGQVQQPQPVSIQLHPVKEFDPKGDPSTVSQRWQKWKKSFVYFLNATGIQNDSQKRAAHLHLVGDEVQDIFET